MVYRLVRSADSDRDLELVFDHLLDSYTAFGDSTDEAFERATSRLAEIEDAMDLIARTPHQGTLRPDLLPGVRHVTKQSTVFYFHVDDDSESVRILAVFFGGQDHIRHMLTRLPPPYK